MKNFVIRSAPLRLDDINFSCRMIEPVERKTCPAFFVSGAFQGMDSWKSSVEFFCSRGTPVILVDLPGGVTSDPLPENYGLEFLADAIKIALDTLEVATTSVVGASYGTPIAYTFAAKHPAVMHRLILAGTMKEIPPHMRQRVANTLIPLRAGLMEQFAREVVEGLVVTDETVPVHRRRLAYRLLYGQLVALDKSGCEKYAQNTLRLLDHRPLDLAVPPSCETLVFAGEYDTFTTPKACLEVAMSIPGSIFTTVDKSDHMFYLEQPSVCNEISWHFLRTGEIPAVEGIGPVQRAGSRT